METSKGTLLIELYSEHAPGTVANFLKLVNQKFYDGLTFHRVIPDFVVQGDVLMEMVLAVRDGLLSAKLRVIH